MLNSSAEQVSRSQSEWVRGGVADYLCLNPYAAIPPPPLPPIPTSSSLAIDASSQRKKNKIQWLVDDAHRRATFRKRRKGIMKKAEELHILCGVKTCAIIYGPGEQLPEVWPSIEEAAAICRGFRMLPELQQLRMMRTNSHFLQEQVIKKAQQQSNHYDEIAEAQARCHLYDGLLGADLDINRECLLRLYGMTQDMLRQLYERCTALRAQLRGATCQSLISMSLRTEKVQAQASPENQGDVFSGSAQKGPLETFVSRFLYGERSELTDGSNSCEEEEDPTSEIA